MSYSKLTASWSAALLLVALSTTVEANNPNQMKQAQQAKQQQALKRQQNLRNLKQDFADQPESQQKAQIKKVVLPKLRARIANDQKKIKSKDKAIKAENKKLASAVKQRVRAQQQLESVDRQLQDLDATTARRAGGADTTNQRVKLDNLRLAAQKGIMDANASIQRHRAEIKQLNNERKVHNDRLVRHLKQKRDGKALISSQSVLPQYARARAGQVQNAAAAGENRYQSFAQARRARPRSTGGNYMSVNDLENMSPDAPPSNPYGRLQLRAADAANAEAPEADQYVALPTVTGQRARELTQSSDANGNYVLLPSAPAASVSE